jgi:hypothetical protein
MCKRRYLQQKILRILRILRIRIKTSLIRNTAQRIFWKDDVKISESYRRLSRDRLQLYRIVQRLSGQLGVMHHNILQTNSITYHHLILSVPLSFVRMMTSGWPMQPSYSGQSGDQGRGQPLSEKAWR